MCVTTGNARCLGAAVATLAYFCRWLRSLFFVGAIAASRRNEAD
jgi:hypothetical protein